MLSAQERINSNLVKSNYDDFVETMESFDVEINLEEDDYHTAIEKINKLEIESGGSFADKYNSGSEKTLVYDSIAKAYINE